ncbi:MAG TPA: DUF6776 family protein [Woeseiaceae bacterium]|nr:DUF6776 family protein [Woeseiaceae bacterium]
MERKSVAYKTRSAQGPWVRLLILGLVAGALYLSYEFGRIRAGYDVLEAARERGGLEERIAELENERLALSEQVALLETHREIDREAYAEVEKSLDDLQAKIQEQQDAIAFYRGIVSPADGNSGLRVQDFRLTRGPEEREYNIRIVLVQAMKHDRKVSGDVSLSIAGVQDGELRSYDYRDLLPEDGESKWSFSFRYFQDFDRQVVLPDGFEPERVTVHVESRTKSIASIEESYAWLSGQG